MSVTALRDFETEDLLKELERREMNIPDTVVFTHYLHDQYNLMEWHEIMEDRTGFGFSDEIMKKARSKFYELKLVCEMDTRTGEVTILEIG